MLTKENIKFYWVGAVVFGVLATLYLLSIEFPKSSVATEAEQVDFIFHLIFNVIIYLSFLWQVKNKKFILKKKLKFTVFVWAVILYQGLKFFAATLSYLGQVELVIATSVSLAALGLTYPHDKYFSDTLIEEDPATIEQQLSAWTSITGIRFIWYSCFGFTLFMILISTPMIDFKEITVPMTSLHQAVYAFLLVVPILVVIFNYQILKKKLFTDKTRSVLAWGAILTVFSFMGISGMVYVFLDLTFNVFIAYGVFVLLNFLLVFPRKKDFGPSVSLKSWFIGERA